MPLADNHGNVVSSYNATASYFSEDLGNGVTLEIAQIPGGSFQMGSDFVPPSNYDGTEQPVHPVSISPFSLGVNPVTRGQWRQVSTYPMVSVALHAIPPGMDDEIPMDVVFDNEAVEFCARLSNHSGRSYRLPTESEWEYACRAGTYTVYHFGNGISLRLANYNDLQRPLGLTPVGSKQAPNRFGLNDMHGNVLELCQDWSHPDYKGAPPDNRAWVGAGDSFSRIARGGMFLWGEERARSAARTHWDVREAAGGNGFRIALSASFGLLDPQFQTEGVVSAASNLAGSVAPGEILTIYGRNIGPTSPSSLATNSSGQVAAALAGTQVLFDGIPAPLLYVSLEQINVAVPYGITKRASTEIVVFRQGQTSAPVSVGVKASAPAIFTADGSGTGQGAILNQDGSLNSAKNPARPGSVIAVFGTGSGQTNPPGVDGKLGTHPLPSPVLSVKVLINGITAEVQYAAGALGEIAGVLQVNARLPDSIASGAQSILLVIGQAKSQPGVFITIG